MNELDRHIKTKYGVERKKEPSIPISKLEELIKEECFSVNTYEFESTTVIDIDDLQELINEAKK